MTTQDWLGIFALMGGFVGYIEYRLKEQRDGRHSLATRVQETERYVAKLMVKVFGDINGH